MSDELKLTARFDRTLISEGGDSVRYLFVELTAPTENSQFIHLKSSPGHSSTETSASYSGSPLNLAVVIDSSRSMVGERLHAAVRATQEIIDGLTDNDFISIISFSGDALVHADGVSCDNLGKELAREALGSICLRAGTNLSEGWFKGAECVGKVMLAHTDCKNHVLILSDGHANEGTLEPTALLHHATELQTRGVTASAVGVGEGYSTAQLYAIAQHGGGRIHHATHPPEIVEVVSGELDELRERVIENLTVNIQFPSSITLKSLNIIPCELTHSNMRCVFGGMCYGNSRAAVFRIGTSPGREKEELQIKITAQWRPSGQSEMMTALLQLATLQFETPEQNAIQPVDQAVSFSIAKSWQSWIAWQATNLNRARDYSRLERHLSREIKYFRRFCRLVPETSLRLAELEHLAQIAHQDWDETSRKEIQTSTYTTGYNIRDSRSNSRKWQDYTGQIRIK